MSAAVHSCEEGKENKTGKVSLIFVLLWTFKQRSNHSKLSLCVGKNMPIKLADSSPQNRFLNKQFHVSRQQSFSKQNYPLYVLFFKPHLDIFTLRNNSL